MCCSVKHEKSFIISGHGPVPGTDVSLSYFLSNTIYLRGLAMVI